MTTSEAQDIQSRLASRVVVADRLPGEILTIGGVDVAYDENSSNLVGAIAVLDARTLETIASAVAEGPIDFPYIPGLFSFRELPALARVLDQLPDLPDIIICDGHGIAHPRRFGLASHLGVAYDVAAIGCAKTLLVGDAGEPATWRGASAPLKIGSEVVGAVLRTQNNVKPVYVSSGHRISLESACDWVLRTSPRFRISEPVRSANKLVNDRRAILRRA
jgi:deoxyribonuclease V